MRHTQFTSADISRRIYILSYDFEYISRYGGYLYIFSDFQNFFLLIVYKKKYTQLK
jgi:hypothetical protein